MRQIFPCHAFFYTTVIMFLAPTFAILPMLFFQAQGIKNPDNPPPLPRLGPQTVRQLKEHRQYIDPHNRLTRQERMERMEPVRETLRRQYGSTNR